MSLRSLVLGIITLTSASLATAGTIITTLGDVSFSNGNSVNQSQLTTADGSGNPADAAPFSGVFCGADPSSNCSTTWAFNFVVPVTDTILSASIDVGIGDLDSHAPGNQIANYNVAGDDLTAALNTQAETADLHNGIYWHFVVSLDSSAFAQLATGSATVSFATQGPGLGTLGTSTFNGVFLDYSTLTIVTQPPLVTPEPASFAILWGGLTGLGLLVCRQKRR